MKRFLSTTYSAAAFNFSMFVLRLVSGICMLVNHGYTKVVNFSGMQTQFVSFLGLSPKASLILDIFAEVFCSLFIILGLFTRLAVLPLIIVMLTALLTVKAGGAFDKMEIDLFYLGVYIVILLCGPGSVSVDGMINK